MYDKTETRIIEQVYLKPSIHKRELAKQLHLGMPSVEYALRKIDQLLKKHREGNRIKYHLDYSNEGLVPMLYAVEFTRFERLTPKIKLAIRDFMTELKEKPLISIIFGSYARGDYLSSSDIDIFLVYSKLKKGKEIENVAKKVSMRTNTRINPIYLDYDSFRESFHNPRKSFFKNLKKDKIILVGIEYWRELKNEEA